MAGVWHQHAIAAGERQIGGQRRALVAALLLDDLNQQHLTALDHVLDLVAAAKSLTLLPQFVGGGLIDGRTVGAGAGFFGSRFGFVAVIFLSCLFDIVMIVAIAVIELGRAQPLFFRSMLGFLTEERFTVGLGDLIVI